ncbi:MAG: hypothetical protein JW808_09705 [Victivallales bacterium]|nr:hypothetical protein [Victivallales bacterium]
MVRLIHKFKAPKEKMLANTLRTFNLAGLLIILLLTLARNAAGDEAEREAEEKREEALFQAFRYVTRKHNDRLVFGLDKNGELLYTNNADGGIGWGTVWTTTGKPMRSKLNELYWDGSASLWIPLLVHLKPEERPPKSMSFAWLEGMDKVPEWMELFRIYGKHASKHELLLKIGEGEPFAGDRRLIFRIMPRPTREDYEKWRRGEMELWRADR